ncbi:MAG: M23 family metallopeptidase [Clostridia bacterium]|nr:M23 family metallopeptidase [Clostridia bacterium]
MQNVKKHRFSLLKLLLVQAVVVSILLAVLYAVKKVSPKDYDTIAKKYVDVAENEQANEGVKKAWSKIKAFFVDENNQKQSTEQAGGKDEDVNGNRYPDNCTASKYVISENICRPAQGKISSPFGYRINPVSEKLSFHTGIDIAADSGDKVSAAYYGIVEEAGEDDVYGKYIKINHGNGIQTFYAHCSRLYVAVGDKVDAGETVALVGSTGWSTGPHLHFAIIINGIYCNPTYVID